jgi:hypothetical protein
MHKLPWGIMISCCRIIWHPGTIMPSDEHISFWMLEDVATCMTALIIHNSPHRVVDLAAYLVASTCISSNIV